MIDIRQKKILICLLIAIPIIASLYLMEEVNETITSNIKQLLQKTKVENSEVICRNDGVFEIENILNDEEKLLRSNEENIFFIEAHMTEFREFTSARQACSVESAALANPSQQVYFLGLTSSHQSTMKYSDIVNALLSYSNINFRFLNPVEFSKGTPLEDFFARDELSKSSYIIEHTADVLRILTLYKFGGAYLDLDAVCFKSFHEIENDELIPTKSFACVESKNMVGSCILKFDRESSAGILRSYLENVNSSYSASTWGGNGPQMVTKAIKTECPDQEIYDRNYTHCGSITILPQPRCVEFNYWEWSKFFEEKNTEEVLRRWKETDSYFAHFFNKMQFFDNKTYELEYTSKSAYMEIAKKICPRLDL